MKTATQMLKEITELTNAGLSIGKAYNHVAEQDAETFSFIEESEWEMTDAQYTLDSNNDFYIQVCRGNMYGEYHDTFIVQQVQHTENGDQYARLSTEYTLDMAKKVCVAIATRFAA